MQDILIKEQSLYFGFAYDQVHVPRYLDIMHILLAITVESCPCAFEDVVWDLGCVA